MNKDEAIDRSIVIIGLPGSGKTTYLAALWHLVTSRELPTQLSFHKLGKGDRTHLNQISEVWREAKAQERTAVQGMKTVSMNLLDSDQSPVIVTFPDVPGEEYRRMWEERLLDVELAQILDADAILFFIHADTIRAPRWVVDMAALAKQMGIEANSEGVIQWHPRLAPTQVQIIDILQQLCNEPFPRKARKLGIMLSAWDKVSVEALLPERFLEIKMPLLHQYLSHKADGWDCKVFGVSAQGGDYDAPDKEPVIEAETARKLENASTRIKLVHKNNETHDLTEPLSWLMK